MVGSRQHAMPCLQFNSELGSGEVIVLGIFGLGQIEIVCVCELYWDKIHIHHLRLFIFKKPLIGRQTGDIVDDNYKAPSANFV